MSEASPLTWIDREFADGYHDGRDANAPEPSTNRSVAYRHSFVVGRAEIAGCPIPAAISRERAQGIEAAEAAETAKLGSVHDGPVAESHAPKGNHPSRSNPHAN